MDHIVRLYWDWNSMFIRTGKLFHTCRLLSSEAFLHVFLLSGQLVDSKILTDGDIFVPSRKWFDGVAFISVESELKTEWKLFNIYIIFSIYIIQDPSLHVALWSVRTNAFALYWCQIRILSQGKCPEDSQKCLLLLIITSGQWLQLLY